MVPRQERVWGLPLKRIILNTAGEPSESDLCIEGNNLLYRGDGASPFVEALTSYLTNESWDELVINGAGTESAAMKVAKNSAEFELDQARRYEIAPYGQRWGLRFHAIGQYARTGPSHQTIHEHTHGPIEVRISQSPHDVLTELNDLIELHESRWRSKGMSGAFAARGFTKFHQTLATRASESGRVHVVRVCSR